MGYRDASLTPTSVECWIECPCWSGCGWCRLFHCNIPCENQKFCQKLTQSQVWRTNKMKENHSHLKTCDRVWNRSAQSVVVKSSVKDPRLQSVWLICVDASSNSHKAFSLLNRPISEGNGPESWFSANRLFSWARVPWVLSFDMTKIDVSHNRLRLVSFPISRGIRPDSLFFHKHLEISSAWVRPLITGWIVHIVQFLKFGQSTNVRGNGSAQLIPAQVPAVLWGVQKAWNRIEERRLTLMSSLLHGTVPRVWARSNDYRSDACTMGWEQMRRMGGKSEMTSHSVWRLVSWPICLGIAPVSLFLLSDLMFQSVITAGIKRRQQVNERTSHSVLWDDRVPSESILPVDCPINICKIKWVKNQENKVWHHIQFLEIGELSHLFGNCSSQLVLVQVSNDCESCCSLNGMGQESEGTHKRIREVRSHSSMGIDPSSWLSSRYLIHSENFECHCTSCHSYHQSRRVRTRLWVVLVGRSPWESTLLVGSHAAVCSIIVLGLNGNYYILEEERTFQWVVPVVQFLWESFHSACCNWVLWIFQPLF